MFDICQQVDEFVPYEVFSSHLKQFNMEQKDIVDDMLHKKSKHPTKSLHIFLIGGTRKNFTHVYYTKHVTTLYKKYYTC